MNCTTSTIPKLEIVPVRFFLFFNMLPGRIWMDVQPVNWIQTKAFGRAGTGQDSFHGIPILEISFAYVCMYTLHANDP